MDSAANGVQFLQPFSIQVAYIEHLQQVISEYDGGMWWQQLHICGDGGCSYVVTYRQNIDKYNNVGVVQCFLFCLYQCEHLYEQNID